MTPIDVLSGLLLLGLVCRVLMACDVEAADPPEVEREFDGHVGFRKVG